MERLDYCYYQDAQMRFYDCDNKANARISSVMKYIADIAGLDYKEKGYSHEWLWENGYVFLLSKVSLRINKIPKSEEKIVIETWEKGTKGPLFYRDINIYSQEGEKLVEASTAWILANPVSRKILRPEEFSGKTHEHPEKAAQVLEVGKIKNDCDLIFRGIRKIVYSDIDANNHVYNAVYADIACDFLPHEIMDKEVTDFRINFKHEAVLDDEISMFYSKNGDTVYVYGEVNEEICFECEFYIK
ncbi:MAG: thioesterase [Oscillospiraceae bacterium]